MVPGQFLVKDFVLFGASLWLVGDDWRALAANGSHQRPTKEREHDLATKPA